MSDDNDSDSPWMVLAIGAFCLWGAYYLHGAFGELAAGQRETVRVWWGVALLYKTLGAGVTVSAVALLGAIMTLTGMRRLFS